MIVPFDIPDCTFEPCYLLFLAQMKLAVYDGTAEMVIKEKFFQDGISFK